jgi:sec-independent protein translocase protein TatC
MRKYRKISLVLVMFLSAVITPPDVASQIIVAIPVLILYELSIFISKRVIKSMKKKKKN